VSLSSSVLPSPLPRSRLAAPFLSFLDFFLPLSEHYFLFHLDLLPRKVVSKMALMFHHY